MPTALYVHNGKKYETAVVEGNTVCDCWVVLSTFYISKQDVLPGELFSRRRSISQYSVHRHFRVVSLTAVHNGSKCFSPECSKPYIYVLHLYGILLNRLPCVFHYKQQRSDTHGTVLVHIYQYDSFMLYRFLVVFLYKGCVHIHLLLKMKESECKGSI